MENFKFSWADFVFGVLLSSVFVSQKWCNYDSFVKGILLELGFWIFSIVVVFLVKHLLGNRTWGENIRQSLCYAFGGFTVSLIWLIYNFYFSV